MKEPILLQCPEHGGYGDTMILPWRMQCGCCPVWCWRFDDCEWHRDKALQKYRAKPLED